MVRKLMFVSLVGIIGGALLMSLHISSPSTTHAQAIGLDVETQQRILKATVQIKMVRENIRESETGTASDSELPTKQEVVMTASEGIGTLLSIDGENVIVTHNHWTKLPDDVEPYRVRFYNAQGEWLWEIDSIEFERNALYRDAGTLVMRAPDELVNELEPVEGFSYSQELALGDTVYVVRWQPDKEMGLGFLAAKVIEVNDGEQQSLMTLQSVDGQSIEPGDSGGGIWSNSSLVGNMWMTIREEWRYPDNPEEVTVVSTDRSRAAGLTESVVQSTGESLRQLDSVSASLNRYELQ